MEILVKIIANWDTIGLAVTSIVGLFVDPNRVPILRIFRRKKG